MMLFDDLFNVMHQVVVFLDDTKCQISSCFANRIKTSTFPASRKKTDLNAVVLPNCVPEGVCTFLYSQLSLIVVVCGA